MIYQIITDQSILGLATRVNEALAHDWIPAGGLCIYQVESADRLITQPRTVFAQALTSYAPPVARASGDRDNPSLPRHYKD
jgi:hypothetical protein